MALSVFESCASFEPVRSLERKTQIETTFCGRIEAGWRGINETSQLMGRVTYPFGTQIADKCQQRQVKNVGIGELLVHEDIQTFFDIPLNDPQRVCVSRMSPDPR